MLSYNQLVDAVSNRSAVRRRRRLQPAGGKGDKLFPPTYPGQGNNEPPRHVFELRRIDAINVPCVLIDSVQSQANRLEESLLEAAKAGAIRLPRIVVDFPAAGLNSVPQISSLEAPHRIFDAILRDSKLNGAAFRKSDIGLRIREATPQNATAILEVSPTALLFGSWNSTGEGGAMGSRFARSIVSEIVGIGVPVEEQVDSRTGEVSFRSAGRRTGSRIDPLGILRSVEVYKSDTGWDVDAAKAGPKAKRVRPSEINHGNITPSVERLGVTCDYVLATAVISFAGLRRLRFGEGSERNVAARAYLASAGLLALLEQDARGYALRSRCDLVCEEDSPFELVAFNGATEPVDLDLSHARGLHEEAFELARNAGFSLNPEPLVLVPEDKLIQIVRMSQEKALRDEGGEAANE
jgi:CRISPR-associated protein Csb1